MEKILQIIKVTISEYNNLLATYRGKDSATDLLMIKRNLTPAAISFGICNELISLCGIAKFQTNTNASWQKSYEGKVLHIYE